MNKTLRFKKPASSPLTFAADLLSTANPVKEEKGSDGATVLHVPVLPYGEYDHQLYGKLDWTDQKFDQMISNFAAQATGYQPKLGVEHQRFNPFASEDPAYGWILELYKQPGIGLFAKVELTDIGETAYRNKHYRYFSAEVQPRYVNSLGQEFENVISGHTLTNTPFHDTMPGLFSDAPALTAQLFRMGTDFSFDEIEDALEEALAAEMGGQPYCSAYVREVFPDFFIYEVWSWLEDDEETYFRRGYTFADGQVTLEDAASAVEVEEVWVEKARQQLSQARKAVRRLQQPEKRAQISLAQSSAGEKQAGLPAIGGRMKNIIKTLRQKFGLEVADDATEDQLVAAVEKVETPAPAAEPEKVEDATLSQKAADVQALSQQVQALTARVADAETSAKLARDKQVEAEANLLNASAAREVDALVLSGKVLPAQRESALKLAQTDPVLFKQLYDGAQPQINLGGAPFLRPNAEGSDRTFSGLVRERMEKNPSLSFSEAADLVAADEPALYDEYRKAGR